MPKAIWHHMISDGDEFPHIYAKPTDCYCEPEVVWLDVMHVLVTHQDMREKKALEVTHG